MKVLVRELYYLDRRFEFDFRVVQTLGGERKLKDGGGCCGDADIRRSGLRGKTLSCYTGPRSYINTKDSLEVSSFFGREKGGA